MSAAAEPTSLAKYKDHLLRNREQVMAETEAQLLKTALEAKVTEYESELKTAKLMLKYIDMTRKSNPDSNGDDEPAPAGLPDRLKCWDSNCYRVGREFDRSEMFQRPESDGKNESDYFCSRRCAISACAISSNFGECDCDKLNDKAAPHGQKCNIWFDKDGRDRRIDLELPAAEHKPTEHKQGKRKRDANDDIPEYVTCSECGDKGASVHPDTGKIHCVVCCVSAESACDRSEDKEMETSCGNCGRPYPDGKDGCDDCAGGSLFSDDEEEEKPKKRGKKSAKRTKKSAKRAKLH